VIFEEGHVAVLPGQSVASIPDQADAVAEAVESHVVSGVDRLQADWFEKSKTLLVVRR